MKRRSRKRKMKKPNLDPNQNIKEVINNQKLRKALAFESHYWFFHIYLSHYVQYPTADFQKEMFRITEDDSIQNAVIVAFRGSAKSTIFSLSYPLWAMVGKPQMRFIVLSSQTSNQSRMILKNIRKELETNELLRRDYGRLDMETDEWRSNSIVVPRFDTRISSFSTGEGIRGVKHGSFRPDLIICDDVEDLQSVKTREGRDKTNQWLQGEVIPAGTEKTKLIVVGNLLHEDSLVVRLKEAIEEGEFNGIFREYPLVDDSGKIFWPGRFPDHQAIKVLRKRVAEESAWSREYLLKIISNVERVVHPSWIHYYDSLPKNYDDDLELIATGIDLAISEKASADYTAMVSAYMLCDDSGAYKIYICPNPVNERLTFPDTVTKAKYISTTLGQGQQTLLYVEEVGYQKALIQRLIEEGYQAEGVKPKGQDKRSRLVLTTGLIQNGTILFPRSGAKELIQQLTGFGREKHDDLADAFSILILKIIENMNDGEPDLFIAELGENSYRILTS